VSPFFYPLVVEDSRETVTKLLARGIEAVEFWRGPHPACDMAEFPEVAWLRKSIVEIPCHQDLSLATLARVASAVREVVAGGQELAASRVSVKGSCCSTDAPLTSSLTISTRS
jgi:dTDP-4-amino-4,6-dideoxygalactose transaminase